MPYGYSVRKVDRNQNDMVRALRDAGYGVLDLHIIGGGAPDLLVLTPGGQLELVEIKMPGEGLTPDERDWHQQWLGRGGHVHIAYDHLTLIQELVHEHSICSSV